MKSISVTLVEIHDGDRIEVTAHDLNVDAMHAVLLSPDQLEPFKQSFQSGTMSPPVDRERTDRVDEGPATAFISKSPCRSVVRGIQSRRCWRCSDELLVLLYSTAMKIATAGEDRRLSARAPGLAVS